MRNRSPFVTRVVVGLLLVATFVATGCGALRDDEGRPLTTLNPQGKPAQQIDDLVKPVFIVAGVVFVLVEGAIVYMAIRYRRRKGDEDGVDEPVQVHGIPRLEWTWTIVPAIILGVLAVFNVQTIWELEKRDADAITIEVYGQQWWWEYRYDINDDGNPDVIAANQMVIPAGRQINLEIRSNDVIHSFWIPALSGKKDAVPGRTQTWVLQAEQPGLYQGTCTEFCGLSHAYMRMEVKALSAADYETWLDEQQEPVSDESLALEGYETFLANCAQCHQINGLAYPEEGEQEKTDGVPNPNYGAIFNEDGQLEEQQVPLTSDNAPNLTHLMSRNKFAGNLFDLYTEDGKVNTANLYEWIKDPEAMKPMAPDEFRGMPTLPLSEEQINSLVAFLQTLK